MAIYFPNSELNECACESWRITSNFTGDNNRVGGNSMTNWERADDVYGGSNLASPYLLSNSGAVFSFNITGWYLITYQHYCYMGNAHSRWNEMKMLVSWNSGANYDQHSYSVNSIANNSSSATSSGGSASNLILGNSNTRLAFDVSVENNSVITYGTTNEQMTGFTATLVASENP